MNPKNKNDKRFQHPVMVALSYEENKWHLARV